VREHARTVAFLLERQDCDGLWRDYELEPGAADAWVTSAVGLALARADDARVLAAVRSARQAVQALRRPDGWGYNSATACDADSTAWATLFAGGPWTLAAAYLDALGRACTFRGAHFGTWARAHDDVTPVVGSALAAAGAPAVLVRSVRLASLRACDADYCWRSFWWTTAAYALARNLAFLSASGGIPAAVAAGARALLARCSAPASALEAALLLEAAACVGASTRARRDGLLSLRQPDGGWPPSATLLVPSQADGEPGPGHADVRGLFTTAAALTALGRTGAQGRP
jgi:hypothetical protein